jgi:hypothetical protein
VYEIAQGLHVADGDVVAVHFDQAALAQLGQDARQRFGLDREARAMTPLGVVSCTSGEVLTSRGISSSR